MAEQINERLYDDDELNLVEYWLVVRKYKWLIMILSVASLLVALIVGLLSPKIYESTSTILTPSESGGDGGTLLSFLSSAGVAQGSAGSSIPSLTPNKDVFLSILKSRTLARKVVEEFDLKDHYKISHIESAINALRRSTSISESLEGVIIIRIEDKNPILAADIANGYPFYLDRFMAQHGTGAERRKRRFIEAQLTETKVRLTTAEEKLKHFQQKNRAISLINQAQGAINLQGVLKKGITDSEVELQVMRNFATELNPRVISLKGKIVELKHQLAQVQYETIELPGITANPGHTKMDIYIPLVKVPEVSLELARLTRDLDIQSNVYILLTQQLEQVKIAEAEDTPVVQILDRAVPAIRKSKPTIALNMAMTGSVSFILTVLLAFFLEYIARQRSRQRPQS